MAKCITLNVPIKVSEIKGPAVHVNDEALIFISLVNFLIHRSDIHTGFTTQKFLSDVLGSSQKTISCIHTFAGNLPRI